MPCGQLLHDAFDGDFMLVTYRQDLGQGRYRYSVTHLQVFQLQIQPVVDLRTSLESGRLVLEATDCALPT